MLPLIVNVILVWDRIAVVYDHWYHFLNFVNLGSPLLLYY